MKSVRRDFWGDMYAFVYYRTDTLGRGRFKNQWAVDQTFLDDPGNPSQALPKNWCVICRFHT